MIFLLFGVIVLVFILALCLSSIIQRRTGTEIILLAILFVLVGFYLDYFDPVNMPDTISVGLVLFGLVIGVSCFLFKQN